MQKLLLYIVITLSLVATHPVQLVAQGSSSVGLSKTSEYTSDYTSKVNFISFDLGPDTAICNGNCVYLEGPPDMVTYIWYEDGLLYSSSQSIEPCPSDTTQYSLLVVDQFNNSDSDTIQINVWPTPIVEIHPSDTTIALGDCVELFGAVGDYTWVWDSLGVQISTSQNIIVCPDDTTQYNHIATNLHGCSAEDSTVISINFLSFDLGPDSTICEGSCVTISGPDDMVEYTWIVADTVYATVQIIDPCPIDTTQYTLWVEDNLGATAVDSIVINVLPMPFISISPSDTTINEGACVELTGAEGNYIYEWFIGDLPVGSTQIIDVCPNDTTQYNLVVTDELECSAEDSAMVNIEFLSFSLGGDQTICDNSCFEIIGPDDMIEYNWFVADTLYSSAQTIIPCPLEETQYILWVEDEYGAIAADSIIIKLKPNPTVDFEDDSLYVSLGDDILLTVSSSAGDGNTFSWNYNGDTFFSFSNNFHNLVKPTISDYVFVMLQAENECAATDSAYLTVFEYPEITVSNDTSVCSNQPVTLEVSGGEIFLWIVEDDTISTNSTITVFPQVSTNYIAQTAFANSSNYSVDTVAVTVYNSTNTKILYDTNTVCTYVDITLTASGATNYLWMPSEDTNQIFTFTIVDTTQIWLIGLNNDGCESVDSATFYNKPSPVVKFTGLLPVFCENDPFVELIGTPPGGIFTGEGIVDDRFYPQNTEAGVHDIIYSFINSENCVGYDTNTTTIYGNEGSINLGADFNIPYDSTSLLDAGIGFDSYFWTSGATTQTITVLGSEKTPGTYEYAVMGIINGCSTRGSVNITFENADGYLEHYFDDVTIFPNPNNGSFSIRFNSIEKNIEIKIYNLQGKLMYEDINVSCDENCTTDVDLNNTKPGFHFLRISTSRGTSISKIILK